MALITVAAVQMACGPDPDTNLATAERLVRRAAEGGAQIVLLPELFSTPYFCKDQDPAFFALAGPVEDHPVLAAMRVLAAKLGVVLPISFFERANNAHYNSLAVIDADGSLLGTYRKSHIPDGPGYQEKFYFNPGDSGLPVFRTRYAALGCAICWDQWFPEAARILALRGADLLLYPTAIGSEPQDPGLDTRAHWTRVMQGHAAANLVPVIAANRFGSEVGQSCTIDFYGSSFIAGPTGELVVQAEPAGEAVLTARLDLAAIRMRRVAWGVFRDRRPDLYGPLLTGDGGGPTL
ncbi:MAG: N-carbamoylputrescine amidase [Alphaproteobacteria bacterium]|jgi:N-carbamoylputrescine amidase|nr:N-carbamoylputrescine amidase [Alphaproteobacteria bacterium]